MAAGNRHYGHIRATATHWLHAVEIDPSRIDDYPLYFSGGMMQRFLRAMPRGAALVGIFHDKFVRDAAPDRERCLEPLKEDA